MVKSETDKINIIIDLYIEHKYLVQNMGQFVNFIFILEVEILILRYDWPFVVKWPTRP